ncbi:RHS repeat-associated protein [Flavobacterium arsenatis]|uniref:RHS repeat-associated protein n=1 Tax=Flavobacterium arsenatis TaxID=1484332 RepID=A0ABU1TSM3_9FLAO|nr:RHS repeat-associated core domain-containing protein [Flavobacterium arsenatis]MDR6968889.1 RHS repeat-associated protein [Flavobacterium arsenatis]
MTEDWNKGIHRISYNHLNLPTKIEFDKNGVKTIDYLYNALGVKLKKMINDKLAEPSLHQDTDYLGGFQYVDNKLQFFPTAEGYVSVVEDKDFNYVYSYKDHLGNIRLSYSMDYKDDALKVLEENHYYPFGMKHSYNKEIYEWGGNKDDGTLHAILAEVQRSNYQYKFQGQERQDELSLNWDSFKYRNYDYAIGRFMNIDPLAEDYTYQSPYNFAENKVISHLELEGLEGIHSSKVDGAGIRTHVIQKNVVVLTQAPRPINAGASPERAARIEMQNARIAESNIAKVNSVKAELKSFYSGAKNSAGESVDFQFNVIAQETNNTDGGSTRDVVNIGVANGVESGETAYTGAPNSVAPAAVITTDSSRGLLGLTKGNVKVTVNSSVPGVTAHEVAHTLMTGVKKEDDYPGGNGGLMDSPPGQINAKEVDRIIEDSYEKKK